MPGHRTMTRHVLATIEATLRGTVDPIDVEADLDMLKATGRARVHHWGTDPYAAQRVKLARLLARVAKGEAVETWGGRIRSVRSAAHLTQEQLAACLGVTARTIKRWEGDHAPPTPKHQAKLAGLLLTLDPPNRRSDP